jgi:hypothetical protein
MLSFLVLQILITSSFQTTVKECKPRIWGLPDPYQIALHPPSPPIPPYSRFSSSFSSPTPPLKVALITAGSIRSFAFVERSWRKYLLSNSKLFQHSLYLFAHLIVLPHCPISTQGLSLIKSLCTDLEISYSTQLYRHNNDHSKSGHENLTRSFPSKYQDSEFLKQFLTPHRGNFIDMYNRRHRAYQLSQLYRQRHGFQYDLLIFLRPDIAFYSPILNLSMFHHSLISWKHDPIIDPTAPPRQPIYVPEACNFYGVCDRLAIGLPTEMAIYFQQDFVLDVMKWSLIPPVPNSPSSPLYCPKKACLSMSEDLLECWFLMNNLTQVFYSHPIPLTFLTLRSLYAMEYCANSREVFVTQLPTAYFADTDSDKYTARVDMSREYDEEDKVQSVEERCGERFGKGKNLSVWCDMEIYQCSCGDRNTWGTA